jgi:hypothetical protein
MTQVILGKSRVREICMPGSVRAKAEWLSYSTISYGDLGQHDEAWRFIGEAMTTIETTKERWWESELNRTAGELALKSRGANAEESGARRRA